MANNTLMTRIKNKCDTYANWTEKNPVLLKGEIAIVEIPAETGAVAEEPIRLMKCGDGTKKFNELEFIGGLAADVYEWAKASAKPTYTAAEIDQLSDFISADLSSIAKSGNINDLTQNEGDYIIINCGDASTLI